MTSMGRSTRRSTRRLTLADIADVRAYERERDQFRPRIIELKRRRRVHVGTIVALVFENRETMRFQVQEMARVEKLMTDAEIQVELDAYNPMVPEPGQLCATVFLELTSDAQLREWLPKLVGIERSLLLVLPDGDRIRAVVDEQHDAGLTREHVTAAVHYVRFELDADQVAVFGSGEVRLEVDHPHYLESVIVSPTLATELLGDLLPDEP